MKTTIRFCSNSSPAKMRQLALLNRCYNVYVAAFHLIERPMLARVPEDSLDVEGCYMIPLPRWNARVSRDGDMSSAPFTSNSTSN